MNIKNCIYRVILFLIVTVHTTYSMENGTNGVANSGSQVASTSGAEAQIESFSQQTQNCGSGPTHPIHFYDNF